MCMRIYVHMHTYTYMLEDIGFSVYMAKSEATRAYGG